MPRASRNSKYGESFQSRALLSAIFMAIILIAYQNCGRIQQTPEATSNRKVHTVENLSGRTQFSLLEQEILKTHPSHDPRSNTIQLEGQNISLNGELVEWKINLTTKKLTKRYYQVPENDPLGNLVTCTIDSSWIDTLSGLLATSQVCQFEIFPQPEICPQVIESEKHSSFNTPTTTYNLGYRSTPCASYHDICIDQRNLYLVTLFDFVIDHQHCSN